ncbi:diaminopimelate epimerase [Achromatium sp. WMS1]|nr:diaminopimelate epimerase [Achromatium sp. WMS1]
MLRFTKMNGAGNDFVMLDNRTGTLVLSKAKIAQLCDRQRGIGADGLITVESAQNNADFRMRYYNADGSEAAMCGNGARCFGRFVQQLTGKTENICFETLAGIITAQFVGTSVRLNMSEPHSLVVNRSLKFGKQTLTIHTVDTGVPHAVIFVDDIERVDVYKLGAQIRHSTYFGSDGTNVNFVKQLNSQSIQVRTYERGVENETLSCGTGVVASALIFHRLISSIMPISVKVRSGEILDVSFKQIDEIYRNVTLTGPADIVFEGQIAV